MKVQRNVMLCTLEVNTSSWNSFSLASAGTGAGSKGTGRAAMVSPLKLITRMVSDPVSPR